MRRVLAALLVLTVLQVRGARGEEPDTLRATVGPYEVMLEPHMEGARPGGWAAVRVIAWVPEGTQGEVPVLSLAVSGSQGVDAPTTATRRMKCSPGGASDWMDTYALVLEPGKQSLHVTARAGAATSVLSAGFTAPDALDLTAWSESLPEGFERWTDILSKPGRRERLAGLQGLLKRHSMSSKVVEAVAAVPTADSSPLMLRFAVLALGHAGAEHEAASTALDGLLKKPARAKVAEREAPIARAALETARSREGLRQRFLVKVREAKQAHWAIRFTSRATEAPGKIVLIEFFRNGAEGGLHVEDETGTDPVLNVVASRRAFVAESVGEELLPIPRWEMSQPPFATIRRAAADAVGSEPPAESDWLGATPSPSLLMESHPKDAHRVRLHVALLLRQPARACPDWLDVERIHDPAAVWEQRENAVLWRRGPEEVVLDLADGLPSLWRYATDSAQREGVRAPVTLGAERWKQLIAELDDKAYASPRYASVGRAVALGVAVSHADWAWKSLGGRPDTETRRDTALRRIVAALLSDPSVQRTMVDAARTAGLGPPRISAPTDAALQPILDNLIGDLAAPAGMEGSIMEALGSAFPGQDADPDVRVRFMGILREQLEAAVRAAWPTPGK